MSRHNGPWWAPEWLHRAVCAVFRWCEQCGEQSQERLCPECWYENRMRPVVKKETKP